MALYVDEKQFAYGERRSWPDRRRRMNTRPDHTVARRHMNRPKNRRRRWRIIASPGGGGDGYFGSWRPEGVQGGEEDRSWIWQEVLPGVNRLPPCRRRLCPSLAATTTPMHLACNCVLNFCSCVCIIIGVRMCAA